MLVHASSVAINGQAVLLMGPSGAGKSDLALCLIDGGASLISDDQTKLYVKEGHLFAAPPETIAGMIELRHAGVLRLSYQGDVPVALCVELTPRERAIERLPEPFYHSFLDCAVRGFRLPSYEASNPAKIRLALQGSFIDDSSF